MRPAGIHHAAILVTDVVRAARFYTEVLGLTPIPRPDLGFEGAWFACGLQELHLIRTEAAGPASRGHVAYAIDDGDAARAALERAGVPFEERRAPAGAAPAAGRGEVRRFFLRDPDGNLIELVVGSAVRSGGLARAAAAPEPQGPDAGRPGERR